MNAPQAGYLLETPYTGDFYEHLSPAWMSYIGRINGIPSPRLDESFDWCELGCGQGRTAALLAALFPAGRFRACDINAQHVRAAEALRASAKLQNVSFHLAGVAQMADTSPGQFDFVTLHGLYSWVSPEVRDEILDFARRKLRPGGLLMVTYNAMPGWAHLEPLRWLLQQLARNAAGHIFDRAKQAFAEVRKLAKSGARYFTMHPAIAQHLDVLASQDIRYIVHEYLTPFHRAYYHAEVAEAMHCAGLRFVGTMNPADNYAELAVPAAFHEYTQAPVDRLARERLRDYVFNTPFRQDLYWMPKDLPSPSSSLADFSGLAFSMADLPESLPLRGRRGGVAYDLEPRREAVGRLFAALSDGPVEAHRLGAASGQGYDPAVVQLLEELVVAGHVLPVAPLRRAVGWSEPQDAILDLALHDRQQRVPIPCPHTCSARYFDPVEGALTAALLRHTDAHEAGGAALCRLLSAEYPMMRQAEGAPPRPANHEEFRDYARMWWTKLASTGSEGARQLRLLGLSAR